MPLSDRDILCLILTPVIIALVVVPLVLCCCCERVPKKGEKHRSGRKRREVDIEEIYRRPLVFDPNLREWRRKHGWPKREEAGKGEGEAKVDGRDGADGGSGEDGGRGAGGDGDCGKGGAGGDGPKDDGSGKSGPISDEPKGDGPKGDGPESDGPQDGADGGLGGGGGAGFQDGEQSGTNKDDDWAPADDLKMSQTPPGEDDNGDTDSPDASAVAIRVPRGPGPAPLPAAAAAAVIGLGIYLDNDDRSGGRGGNGGGCGSPPRTPELPSMPFAPAPLATRAHYSNPPSPEAFSSKKTLHNPLVDPRRHHQYRDDERHDYGLPSMQAAYCDPTRRTESTLSAEGYRYLGPGRHGAYRIHSNRILPSIVADDSGIDQGPTRPEHRRRPVTGSGESSEARPVVLSDTTRRVDSWFDGQRNGTPDRSSSVISSANTSRDAYRMSHGLYLQPFPLLRRAETTSTGEGCGEMRK